MDGASVTFWAGLFQIIWIDLLLSGDNAIIIALACRSLPKKQQKVGMFLGAGAAVGLRILFALLISYLYLIPLLKVVGGLLLFWIALKLLNGDHNAPASVESSDNLWGAVRTIAIADAVMSLDNVLAITGAAGEHRILFVFGLLLTIPLIIFGSTLILALIQKFPVIIWAGGALLGWIAGGMIVGDTIVLSQLNETWSSLNADGHLMPGFYLKYGISGLSAAIVLIIGYWGTRKHSHG